MKKEEYQRPIMEVLKISNRLDLLVNFSAGGELGEWEEDNTPSQYQLAPATIVNLCRLYRLSMRPYETAEISFVASKRLLISSVRVFFYGR